MVDEAKRRMLQQTRKMLDDRIAVIERDTDANTGWFVVPGIHEDRWVVSAHAQEQGRDALGIPYGGDGAVDRGRARDFLFLQNPLGHGAGNGMGTMGMQRSDSGEIIITPGPTLEQAQALG